MKVLTCKHLATGLLIILCCGFWGCSDPDKRLAGQWELYKYEDGLRSGSESTLLTIGSEGRFILDSSENLFGIIGFRFTVEGSYKTDRSESPSLITFRYDNGFGGTFDNTSIYRLKGPFWNRTLSLALDYELGDDSESALSKEGGPVLVGQKLDNGKNSPAKTAFLEVVRAILQ